MAVYLIDKIKPKNNGTFGMADTVDIDHSDGGGWMSFWTKLLKKQTAAEQQ